MGLFSKRLGEAPIPGEATVVLPARKVKINYEERRDGRELDDWAGMPDGVDVTLRPAGGGAPIAITRGRGHSQSAGGSRLGERYGHVELTVAGEYVVTAAADDATRASFEPRISFKS